jgi:hypothetical protein
MLPRIELRDGGYYLVVAGDKTDGTDDPESWWRVHLATWSMTRRRFVPARQQAATHVVFVARTRRRRSALLQWPERLGRDYAFLSDPIALARLLRGAGWLPEAPWDPSTQTPW